MLPIADKGGKNMILVSYNTSNPVFQIDPASARYKQPKKIVFQISKLK